MLEATPGDNIDINVKAIKMFAADIAMGLRKSQTCLMFPDIFPISY